MARDPFKYFRIEARELIEGLTQGILQLEKSGLDAEVVARLLRLAHTLKGAARVVKQPAIAELAHTAEGILTGHRESGRPISKEQCGELLTLCDSIAARVNALAPAPVGDGETAIPARPAAEESLDTLRVEMRELDALLAGVTEAGVQLGAVGRELGATDTLRNLTSLLVNQLAARSGGVETAESRDAGRAQSLAEELKESLDGFQRRLAGDVERANRAVAEILDLTHRLRLIPAQTLFPALDRTVRDAAEALHKPIDFAFTGGEIRLDANVLGSLRDALMHVVRNAVVHGAESAIVRGAAGKSVTGHVHVAVERRGSRVAFTCGDDGRGIDVGAVRDAAVARGLIGANEAMSWSANRVIALLLAGGLTTSSGAITELSGRGIGLDVVRATTSRLKGEMAIRSEPGRGTTIELEVPISIVALPGLVVEAGGALAAIPIGAVRQTLRVFAADIVRSAESESILHEGQVIPFLPLEALLSRIGSPSRNRRAWSTVIVQSGERRVAIGVDRLVGTSSIVVRSLPNGVGANPIIAGASLDAEGNPQLVLDPKGIVAAVERTREAVPEPPNPRRAPILIIDDSLTTRMLEQSILESAGYEVELAVSAEEGLAKAHAHRYCLFIVDVEMPGMNGFEFVAQTRTEVALRDIPAILVTSRNAAEDRMRGEQAGARAYIVKGEFDQGQLLRTIRGLIG